MSQPASVALATARTLLNDDGIQLWTDVALIPKLQQAHRELQAQLRVNACPITRNTAVSLVAINATVLTTPPTDMIEPITLWEKLSTDPDSAYVRMTEYDPLPVVDVATRLVWWKWTQEAIQFIGAISLRYVKVYYKRTIPLPASGADLIGIADGEFYLGPRTAALAYGSTGNPASSEWTTGMANLTLSQILLANRGRSAGTIRP